LFCIIEKLKTTCKFSGSLDTLPVEKCAKLIKELGGNIYTETKINFTHVVSSAEMELVFKDKSSLQFFPGMEEIITRALAEKIPIVTEQFVVDCGNLKRTLLEANYLLFCEVSLFILNRPFWYRKQLKSHHWIPYAFFFVHLGLLSALTNWFDFCLTARRSFLCCGHWG
jgi:hypothetical protein